MLMSLEINILAVVFSVMDNYTWPKEDKLEDKEEILENKLKSFLLFLQSVITVIWPHCDMYITELEKFRCG